MIITRYQNGNAFISIYEDGTRIINYEDELQLDYPLNIDIRVSSKCSLGYNPITGKAICEFCHESASTDGTEANYEDLLQKIEEANLPKGIELAIGGNVITSGLIQFLETCCHKGYICNLTVNQLHINQYETHLRDLLNKKHIRGLGISYRKDYPLKMDSYFISHPNVVLHAIAGIDTVEDILTLPFQSILVLGYKKFGFGVNYFSKEVEDNLQKWFWHIRKLFGKKHISFDNLAIEQLKIKRFFTLDKWEEFYQGEHSFYIDAVNKTFAPSSKDSNKVSWDQFTIPSYFSSLVN